MRISFRDLWFVESNYELHKKLDKLPAIQVVGIVLGIIFLRICIITLATLPFSYMMGYL